MIFYAFVILIVLFFGRKQIKAYVVNNFGENYLPKDMRYLGMGVAVGALGGIVGSIFDLQGRNRTMSSDELIAYCLGAAIAGVIICAIINANRKNKGKGFWARYCCNSLLFLIAFFPGILIGSLLIWGGVIIVLAYLGYYGLTASGGGNKSRSEIPAHNCCASCRRLDIGGHCMDNPGEVIGNPLSECCNNFSPK